MKGKAIIVILFLLALIILVPIIFRPKDAVAPTEKNDDVVWKLPVIEGSKDDLVSFSIKPNDGINMKVEATGVIKGGYFFEGNILVNILDKNKKLLKAGYGTATTDWMTSGPVSFKTTIDTTDLPGNYGGEAYIEIRNDNPSDNHENDKSIFIPVVIL